MAKAAQLPIKEVMTAIDKKDRNWYKYLTDEKKKAFSAWVIQRYASSVQGKDAAHYLYFTNLFVNDHFMDIKDVELQWLLLTATGTGKVQFHPYIKPPNARKKKDKVSEFLYKLYPLIKRDEIELLVAINSKEELKELAAAHGYDDKQIRDIFGK